MCGLPVAILEFVVYRDPTGCLTAFCFSPFEVRDDSNPSGDGLSHLNRIKLGGAATFTSFFYWGFSLPTSSFFRGLLYFYGIELVNLNPNSILQISAFIYLCEVFLGVRPHFNLFRYLFALKLTQKSVQINVVGGAGLQLRGGRSAAY